MKTRHTSGPWTVTTYSNYEGFSIYGPNGFGCVAERWEARIDDKRNAEMHANARLIAAAPELLEALREYAMAYTDEQLAQLATCDTGMGEIGPEHAKREIRRRAAIAKATGETE